MSAPSHESDARPRHCLGRWMDNVFIEQLWRSLKHEDVYLKGNADGREAALGIADWIAFYNDRRRHPPARSSPSTQRQSASRSSSSLIRSVYQTERPISKPNPT
jgi:hypothetical protein